MQFFGEYFKEVPPGLHTKFPLGIDKATENYSKAFNQSPQAVEFYEFTRTMQAYRSIVTADSTLVLSTDS